MSGNYKSKFEESVARELKRKKVRFNYEPFKMPFTQPEKHRNYWPDFQIEANSCLIEAKGKLTKEDREKLIWVREQHPGKRIVILFMNSRNKLRKNSKTTYADWATKNGFDYADFSKDGIPERWLK